MSSLPDSFSLDARYRISLVVAVSVVLLVWSFVSFPPLGNNDVSRWNTVWALVHNGSYVIDDAPFSTVDTIKVKIDGEIHTLSSKPAFMSTWLAGFYLPLKWLGLPLMDVEKKAAIRLILVLINLLPFAFFLYLQLLHAHKNHRSPM